MDQKPTDGLTVDELAPGKTRVLLCVAPGFLHDSIHTILQSFHFASVVGEELQALDCWARIQQCRPDVVLIDCSYNHVESFGLAGEIHKRYPGIKCVVITDTIQTGKQVLKNGADVVVPNGFTCQELGQAIRRLANLQPEPVLQAAERKG